MGVHIRELSPTLVGTRGNFGRFYGSAGAIHAKMAIVDHSQVLFLGSMNMDEHSAHENIELAVIVDSEELADELSARLDPFSSYVLGLDEAGRIEWLEDEDGKSVILHDEPEADAWRRLEIEWLSRLVPESEL